MNITVLGLTKSNVNLKRMHQLYNDTDNPIMLGSREGYKGSLPARAPPLENHKNIRFLNNTGPDPLVNHKAIKPAFNVGPLSARQRNAILITFRLRADVGMLLVF